MRITINAYLIFNIGSQNDPSGKEGLSAITWRLLRSGGTKKLKSGQLEHQLDHLGSSISVFTNLENSGIRIWALSKNFSDTWKLMHDMLFNPTFDSKILDIEKQKEMDGIRRRMENPKKIGNLVFNELVYGKDFPAARRSTASSIRSISREDIISFYHQYIKNSKILCGVSGDFDLKDAVSKVKKSFKHWTAKPLPKLEFPTAKRANKPGIYLINREDLTQAVVYIGHLGINRHDPDTAEINVVNFIYGSGGFNSRLVKAIRTNRGLAYEVFGSVGKGKDKGIFTNFCMTKNKTVGQAIRVIKGIMEDITQKQVLREELDLAIKYEQNSFVHLFDSSKSILLQKLIYKFFGYRDDYLDSYIERISKIDQKKFLEIAGRTIRPGQIITLVVGNKNEIIDQLKALNIGDIKDISISQK